MRINSTTIDLYKGSLLSANADVIVNAANREMSGGSGINGAIRQAAGPELEETLRNTIDGPVEVGEVVVTAGFNLKQDYIFHVPGPIFDDKHAEVCANQLIDSYYNCLEEARKLHLSSIGFPSISTGIYGYPLAIASYLAVGAIKLWAQNNPWYKIKVDFWMFQDKEYDEFFCAMVAENERIDLKQKVMNRFIELMGN